MVPYFTPLVTFDLKMKIKKQVRFFVELPNAFFKLVGQPTFQKWILWSKFRLFKKNLNTFDGVGWSKTVAWDPGGAWGPLWTNYDGLETFWKKNIF